MTETPALWVTDTQRTTAARLIEPLTLREQQLVAEAALAGFIVGNFLPTLADASFPDDQDIVVTVLAMIAAQGAGHFPTIGHGDG